MQLALGQVCSLHSPWAKDVEDYAAAHCHALEIWWTKLETYLQSSPNAEARRVLADHGMVAPVASFQGGLLVSQGEARRVAWDLFQRRLDLAAELTIGTVVLHADIVTPLDRQAIDRVRVSLVQAAELATRSGVRIAVEFQSRAPFINNLETAAALLAEVGHPQLGICLDTFHYATGPSKPEDLRHLTRHNLFHVQLNDLAGVPRELAGDSDRILPGDGDIPLEPILQHLRQIDYPGCVSIEILNPLIWQIPPRQFGEIGMTALRKVVGEASMGN